VPSYTHGAQRGVPRRTLWAPAVTLLLAAPLIAEVLPGYTRLSVAPFVLAPEIAVWGGGALLIRDAVRRAGRGWPSIVLLGIALAVAEECVIQQTSLAPLVGLASVEYGRAVGVNWVYLLWALAYEAVFVVVVPVALTEELFAKHRDALWLGKWAALVIGVALLIGAFVAWFAWTQMARTRVFHLPEYAPPPEAILAALTVIVVLGVIALRVLPRVSRGSAGTPPSAWSAGLAAFGLALPWPLLLVLAYGGAPEIPPALPILAGLAWLTAALLIAWRANYDQWPALSRRTAILGALLAIMLGGFLTFTNPSPIDLTGKIVLNLLAVLIIVRLLPASDSGRIPRQDSP
jgi:hypothetical protein